MAIRCGLIVEETPEAVDLAAEMYVTDLLPGVKTVDTLFTNSENVRRMLLDAGVLNDDIIYMNTPLSLPELRIICQQWAGNLTHQPVDILEIGRPH